jgi:hypothetical protein
MPELLDDDGIRTRRTAYACCALAAASRAVDAWRVGDTACARKEYRLALWLMWAQGVMCDTPIGDEEGCTLLPFASHVADLADCHCKPCVHEPEEEPDTPNPPDVPPCQVLWQWEADEVVDELPEDPIPGRRYYVRTGNGDIFTFVDGGTGGFDYGFDFGLN